MSSMYGVNMVYRIVFFRIKAGDFQNEIRFRNSYASIREINYRYGCEKITMLRGNGADNYAYISIWRDMDTLISLKQAPEYAAFVDELLMYVDIVSDNVYCEEAF